MQSIRYQHHWSGLSVLGRFQRVQSFLCVLNAKHYVSMIRDQENGICTRYNDDFITKHRERGALQSLKNNNHGLVHGLVYIKT